MKRKTVWLVLSSLVIVSLILAACAPKAPTVPTTPTAPAVPTTPTTPTAPTVPTKETVAPGKETVKDALGRLVEKPRHGGTLTVVSATPPAGFDPNIQIGADWTALLTNDELLAGNWLKGPIGTKEQSWIHGGPFNTEWALPVIAESWAMPDDSTLIFKIRKGIRWQDKPGVMTGRELTADDVAWSFDRWYNTPGSYPYNWALEKKAYVFMGPNYNSVTSTEYENHKLYDPQKHPLPTPEAGTVVVKGWSKVASWYLVYLGDWCKIYAPEVDRKFGNMNDWRNRVSNSAYLLTDYVSGSSLTYERNPNYWRKHPLYSEDTMPYIDKVKVLIISDPSTRLAALRTAKIDQLIDLSREDALSLWKTNPELKYLKSLPASGVKITPRVDNPKLPTYDKRVRYALAMAIDREAIKRDYYGGEAEILWEPVAPLPEAKLAYVPLSELPTSVQELFQYNPTKAKQLLAEAGYSKGFKASIITQATDVDLLSIIKEYWKAIGVDLELQVKEFGVYTAITISRLNEDMVSYTFPGGVSSLYPLTAWTTGCFQNLGRINAEADPVLSKFLRTVAYEAHGDWPLLAKTVREFTPYHLEQAWFFLPPQPYVYTFWQPWLKDYSGERSVGTWNAPWEWIKYVWIDQDLKQSLTGRK